MNEEKLEQEIQDKGLNAPRLTPELIDLAIKSQAFHIFDGSQLTVCCLTLQNGFTVTGESACVSPENFNAEKGAKIAFENARDKIWMLEGYLLKQKLFESETGTVRMSKKNKIKRLVAELATTRNQFALRNQKVINLECEIVAVNFTARLNAKSLESAENALNYKEIREQDNAEFMAKVLKAMRD